MDLLIFFPIYVILKYAAYSGWCYCGLPKPRNQSAVRSALTFGLVRLGIGIVFGISIFLLVGLLHLGVWTHSWLLYVLVYAPVRYVEWSILAGLLGYRITDAASQRWIVGGIFVSYFADIPIILFSYGVEKGFFQVGRILC
jgi:hypothetical protein